MKLVYTDQTIISLEETLEFIAPKVSHEKLMEIRDQILDAAETIPSHPLQGQQEPYLEHLGLEFRRLIEGNYKIIYRIIDQYIYITDIFDTRQDPDKMKG